MKELKKLQIKYLTRSCLEVLSSTLTSIAILLVYWFWNMLGAGRGFYNTTQMAKKNITQLDLFSGIGGFHLGFEKAGFKERATLAR